MPEHALLITCEHAVNHVPKPYQHLFTGQEAVLRSHRAFDPGALEMARTLAEATSAPLFTAEITRLLVDHNRSPHHRNLWSEFSRNLPTAEQQALLEEYYQPYRQAVRTFIQAQCDQGLTVIHISVHSFTPILHGEVRRADIGVLYDSQRTVETAFGSSWKLSLEAHLTELRVRLNTPYRGRSDCHMSDYRKRFKSEAYLGIELEINQKLVCGEQAWLQQQSWIAESLQKVLRNTP